jgi:hypothetical protein
MKQNIKNKDYTSAVSIGLEVLKENTDTIVTKLVLFDMGCLNYYQIENKIEGEGYFRQLIAQFPYDQLSKSALSILGEWKPSLERYIFLQIKNSTVEWRKGDHSAEDHADG